MREDPPDSPSPAASEGRLLAALFVGGAATMVVEMTASRLIAPFFGTTLIAWSLLIGTVMAAMAVGGWWGGRWIDRQQAPGPEVVYRLLASSGALVLVLVLCSGVALSGAAEVLSLGGLARSVVAIVLLLAAPIAVLGAVQPCAVRLLATARGAGGATGRVYAAHAAGSLVGVFLPGLVLVPAIGTKPTLLAAAAGLMAAGALAAGRPLGAALGVAASLAAWGVTGPLKDLPGLVASEESAYNYIQVCDDRYLTHEVLPGATQATGMLGQSSPPGDTRSRRFLLLNEGFSFHSIYWPDAPHAPFVEAYYDFVALLPLLVERPGQPLDLAAIGLGAGTAPSQWVHFYARDPGVKVDGVEIDPRIIAVAREHFGLAEVEATGHLRCFAEDGRMFLRRRPERRWDLIMLDVYKQPYIPFHLATREAFELMAGHLKPGGVVGMNVVVTHTDSDLFRGLLSALRGALRYVWWLEVPSPDGASANCLVLASAEPLPLGRLDPKSNPRIAARAQALGNPRYLELARLAPGLLRRFREADPALAYRDDHAAVEWHSQKMLVEAATREMARMQQARGAPPRPPGGERP